MKIDIKKLESYLLTSNNDGISCPFINLFRGQNEYEDDRLTFLKTAFQSFKDNNSQRERGTGKHQ